METVFYIDRYFFFNFLMDLISLFAVSRILPRPLRAHRALLSAALGGFYAAVSALYFSELLTLITFFPMLALGAFAAFSPRSRREFRRAFLFYALTECLVGGLFFAFETLLGKAASNAPFPTLLLCVLTLLILGVPYFFKSNRSFDQKIAAMTLTYGNKIHHFYALLDSGNLLIHPQSGLTVALIGLEGRRRLTGDGKIDFTSEITIYTPAGSRVLQGLEIETARVISEGKSQNVPPFFLAFDTLTHSFSGCDLLISPTSLKP